MEKISSRERVLLALQHKETDRVPIAMVCGGINPPAFNDLDKYLKTNRKYGAKKYIDSFLDVHEVGVCGEQKNITDMWGVTRYEVSYGRGCYDEIGFYPLKNASCVEDLKKHDWPQVKDMPIDNIVDRVRQLRKEKNSAIVLSNANPFETTWYMRGLEQAFMDMMVEPEMLHYTMDKVTNFFIEYFKEILHKCNGEIDMVFTADDIGQQKGLLLSLDMWEEFIKPYHVRLNKMIHEMGVKVIYHSDGSIIEAVPGLIDMSIDVLQALQFNSENMDPVFLKSNFGDRLCFEGGMCVQKVLPFDSVSEVIEETKKLIFILGKNGGYLCGPSHYIQAGTPPENITAFFDTAQNFYTF